MRGEDGNITAAAKSMGGWRRAEARLCLEFTASFTGNRARNSTVGGLLAALTTLPLCSDVPMNDGRCAVAPGWWALPARHAPPCSRRWVTPRASRTCLPSLSGAHRGGFARQTESVDATAPGHRFERSAQKAAKWIS